MPLLPPAWEAAGQEGAVEHLAKALVANGHAPRPKRQQLSRLGAQNRNGATGNRNSEHNFNARVLFGSQSADSQTDRF
jgi:hypothetical protein